MADRRVGPLLGLGLDAVAVYRLTRLVTQDSITEPIRDWIEDRADDSPRWAKLSELVTCPWCSSVWLGFGVVAARRIAPRQWQPVAEALSFSAFTAAVQVFITDDTPDD